MLTNTPIVETLAGYRFSPDSSHRREHTRPPERRTVQYLERYDRRTLYYDCIFDDKTGLHRFSAPPFLNLWHVFRTALRQDGQPVKRLRRRKLFKTEHVTVKAPRGSLSLEIDGTTVPITPRDTLAPRFAGLNAVVTINKNNQIDWIRDWCLFNVRAHDAEAAVIYDNESDAYTSQDIADALATVKGLKQVAVISAPYPFGPPEPAKGLERPEFLHASVLNIARVDALNSARAVLNADIDELILPKTELSVFDAVAKHALGMVTLRGQWVYPPPGQNGPARQSEHVFRAVPPRKTTRKWAIDPRGTMGQMGWSCHQVGGILQNWFTNDDRFELLHCHATTTGWKPERLGKDLKVQRDPELEKQVSSYFNEGDLEK